MKKIIALLLVAVMCLSFVACNQNTNNGKCANCAKYKDLLELLEREKYKEAIKEIYKLAENGSNDSNDAETETVEITLDNRKEIAGEWKSPDSGYSITFNEDGTGIDPEDADLTWKYDSELSCYTAYCGSISQNISVKIKTTDDGLRYFTIAGVKYYHSDDYDKGYDLEIAEEIEFINESIIKNRTKVEFDTTYNYAEGISVKFANANIEEGFLYLDAQLTNTTTNLLDLSLFDISGYFVKRTVGYNQISSDNFWRIRNKSIVEIPAGESLDLKLRLHKDITNTKNINYFYVYFSMNNVEYYIDLTEYFE